MVLLDVYPLAFSIGAHVIFDALFVPGVIFVFTLAVFIDFFKTDKTADTIVNTVIDL